MEDKGRVCTTLHARCCMLLDALMCWLVQSVEKGLAYPPTGVLPRAAARQKRQRASRTSSGSAFGRTLHAHGNLSAVHIQCPTPPVLVARLRLELLVKTGMEWRSGGKRRRCALCNDAVGPSRWFGCWVLNPSAGRERRNHEFVPCARC